MLTNATTADLERENAQLRARLAALESLIAPRAEAIEIITDRGYRNVRATHLGMHSHLRAILDGWNAYRKEYHEE